MDITKAQYMLHTYETVPSTMEVAKNLLKKPGFKLESNVIHVVWAKKQTEGRGKWKREWVSWEGNLYVTLIVSPDCEWEKASQLSFVTAVTVADVLVDLGIDLTQVKWPNDILIDGAKAGGILLESEGSQKGKSWQANWVAIGIGLNVKHAPVIEGDKPTTCVSEHLSDPVNLTQLINNICEKFIYWNIKWKKQGFKSVRKRWHDLSYFQRGDDIKVGLPEGKINAKFLDLDENGALIVEDENGKGYKISSGDVF